MDCIQNVLDSNFSDFWVLKRLQDGKDDARGERDTAKAKRKLKGNKKPKMELRPPRHLSLEGQIRNAEAGPRAPKPREKRQQGTASTAFNHSLSPPRPCPDAALALWVTVVAGSANVNPAANLEAQSTVCASEFAAAFFV